VYRFARKVGKFQSLTALRAAYCYWNKEICRLPFHFIYGRLFLLEIWLFFISCIFFFCGSYSNKIRFFRSNTTSLRQVEGLRRQFSPDLHFKNPQSNLGMVCRGPSKLRPKDRPGLARLHRQSLNLRNLHNQIDLVTRQFCDIFASIMINAFKFVLHSCTGQMDPARPYKQDDIYRAWSSL
jgi:hypothetical protein